METNKINYITIQQYLEGMLDKEAMHELEKQALDDPFLADALEGYSAVNKPATRQLSFLQTQLQERIAQQQEDKNRLSFSWQRLSVAAAAGLLFVMATVLFWMKTHPKDPQLASNPKQVDVALMSKDSVDVVVAKKNTTQVTVPPTIDFRNNKNEPKKIAVVRNKPVTNHSTAAAGARVSNGPTQLNEVVIVGYAAQAKKSSVTGALSMIPSNTITGKVTDQTGEPLPGVYVKLLRNGASTVTNAEGRFNLNDSLGGEIQIAHLGYIQKEVKSKPGSYVSVSLDENTSRLNDVVVVGYGRSKKMSRKPAPFIGWDDYGKYLQQNINLPKDKYTIGKVTVTFTVEPDNKLSDFKILKGLTEDTNQEAIRLIKEGPAWQQGKLNTAQVTVEFR